MIKQPNEMDFTTQHFAMIIAGSPGIGKTTLALSAPNPFLFDFDHGISRVKPEHRRTASFCDTYEDMLADMQSPEFKAAESIIIDTGGNLVTLMQPWAKKQDAKAARDGRAMFGVIKREFSRLTDEILGMHKNLITLFHTTEVQKGDIITTRLACEGSTKDIVWTPADFGGFIYMSGAKRIIGFTPTDEYFAKGCHGISGLMEIPQLAPGQPNDFLTRLFETARTNIQAETAAYQTDLTAYDADMSAGRQIIASVKNAASAMQASITLKSMQYHLTSREELSNVLRAKLKELNITWDKTAKCYVDNVNYANPVVANAPITPDTGNTISFAQL